MPDLPHESEEQKIPLLENKIYTAASVFTAENLLREARRQKNLPEGKVPPICVLDPDGDLVDYLQARGRTVHHPAWACYHTRMDLFEHEGIDYGIVGRVVGAPFAVLVAEELFASGCQLLISLTSAGQIKLEGNPPYIILIERALRDEGTSYHYLPPAPYSFLNPGWKEAIMASWNAPSLPLRVGASWTTDAPFRETEGSIEAARAKGILAVEMEAAALYAFGTSRNKQIVCYAHVTNQMAQQEGDFEKGQDMGSQTGLTILSQTASALANLNLSRL